MSVTTTRSRFVIICIVCVFGIVYWCTTLWVSKDVVVIPQDIQFTSNQTKILAEKLARAEEAIDSLKKRLSRLSLNDNQQNIQEKETGKDKERITLLENILKKHDLLWSLENVIPAERELGRDLNFPLIQQSMIDHVTVVLFSFKETRICLKRRIDRVLQEYPKINMIVLISGSRSYENLNSDSHIEYVSGIEREGKALEILASKVTSKYFLYLSPGADISPQKSDQSVSWLLHALEKIAELDFVGGAFLRYESEVKYPVMEIPCYRLRLCNWTLSQSFEYRYSVDDMMICEETSSSFMGRTSSLKKFETFDPTLDTMATTDFFLRAKGKAVVGLRPEVRFPVSSACAASVLSATAEADLKLSFMKKHQLYIIKDSFGHEVKAINSKNYGSLNYGYINNAFGNPFYIRGLQQTLEISADFLESKNISYFIDAGISLGGIKMRGILPWDRDVDLGFHAKGEEVKRGLAEHCKNKGISCRMKSELQNGGLMEIWLYGGESSYTNLYEQAEAPNEGAFIYIHIHGRLYPVRSFFFGSARYYYGNSYLQMKIDPSAKMECGKPGHHACVPEEFFNRGGHWRDHYCQL